MTLRTSSLWSVRVRLVGRVGLLPALSSAVARRASSFIPATAASLQRTPSPKSYNAVLRANRRDDETPETRTRNDFMRKAFRKSGPDIDAQVDRQLGSPFVPEERDYPSVSATRHANKGVRKAARIMVGNDIIWRQHPPENDKPVHDTGWKDIIDLLKEMTPPKSKMRRMAAVRIVLPASWDLEVGNQNVEFVDSTTGLVSKLRVSADHKNDSAIILRGQSAMLAKAADELVEVCKDVQVFQLGEVAAFDYQTKQLWPAIKDSTDGGSTVPENQLDSIWIHKEREGYWINTRYEDEPRPLEWTKESFEDYVAKLVCGRLLPQLALPLYSQEHMAKGKDAYLIDTDGIRVNLIMDAFLDPLARPHITTSVLKMAMSFIAHRGGHRAAAERLFRHAEEWGVPVDTDMFNILLEGYVTKRDHRFFFTVLNKMKSCFFHPNARTWLLFLELTQKEDNRRRTIVAMYHLGLLDDPATRRGIGRVMASYDAYAAFRSGKKLDAFFAQQTTRYGADWLTRDALNSIMKEYLLFHSQSSLTVNDLAELMEKKPDDGRGVDIETINIILDQCVVHSNWDIALWALHQLPRYKCEPNTTTYFRLLCLAAKTSRPHALGAIFFYAALDHKLKTAARRLMKAVLTGTNGNPFWQRHGPVIFDARMAHEAERMTNAENSSIVPWAALQIRRRCRHRRPLMPLVVPLEKAVRELDGWPTGLSRRKQQRVLGLPILMGGPSDAHVDSTILLSRRCWMWMTGQRPAEDGVADQVNANEMSETNEATENDEAPEKSQAREKHTPT